MFCHIDVKNVYNRVLWKQFYEVKSGPDWSVGSRVVFDCFDSYLGLCASPGSTSVGHRRQLYLITD